MFDFGSLHLRNFPKYCLWELATATVRNCVFTGCIMSAWVRWTASWQRWRLAGQQNISSLWQCSWRTCRSAPKWQVTSSHSPTCNSLHTVATLCHPMIVCFSSVFVRHLQRVVSGVGQEQVWMWDPGSMPALGGQTLTLFNYILSYKALLSWYQVLFPVSHLEFTILIVMNCVFECLLVL